MNAREVIAEAIRYGGRATAINKALFVIAGLRARGFVVLSRSEVEEKDKEIAALRGERDFLQEILDARPAINAALPESYIRWSQSLYSGEAARASLEARNAGGNDAR